MKRRDDPRLAKWEANWKAELEEFVAGIEAAMRGEGLPPEEIAAAAKRVRTEWTSMMNRARAAALAAFAHQTNTVN